MKYPYYQQVITEMIYVLINEPRQKCRNVEKEKQRGRNVNGITIKRENKVVTR